MKIQIENIHKSFGAVHANDGIELTIPSGIIQGILGENGAGKSTLMKIISGYIQADSGRILLNGKPVSVTSTSDVIQLGIGMMHQDPMDFPPLSVLDNFLLGQGGRIFPDYRTARSNFMELREKFGFNIHPESSVENLTVGERQQLELLRLLFLGANVLILDEPTTGISAEQKEKIFAALKKLCKEDKTVLFVSHKLEEVEELCDQVAVLRQGKLVGTAKPPYKTNDLVRMMFGKEIKLAERGSCKSDNTRVRLEDLAIEDARLEIKGIHLEVCKGEVIGLAGMEGSGQQLFLRALAGLIRPVSGEIYIDGKKMTGKSYAEFQRMGVDYVPAARLEEGLIAGFSITEHVILTEQQNGFFVKKEPYQISAQEKISEFHIHGKPDTLVEELSGGNQQRTSLALLRKPHSVLLLEHPMRGLDIESTIDIWQKLKEYCKKGTSIFFTSTDLEEIMRYSDRILVFFSGRVTEPLKSDGISVELLGQMIGGKNLEAVK